MRLRYRCFFLNKSGAVVAFEDIEAVNEADAILLAQEALKSRSHHSAIELWIGGRRIYPNVAAA